MVDPASLTIGATVAALVAKAAEKAGNKLGESVAAGGLGVLGRLLGKLRSRFGGSGDSSAAEALTRVEEAPDSPSRIQVLASAVDRHAADDDVFRADLQALVDEAKTAGIDVRGIAQTASGSQIVQAAGITDAEIKVTYGEPARELGE